MHIDWITVSAQIVNFLVLVWLLKRLLYRPVVAAMERRERRIADRLDDAEARERLAEERAREYEHSREALERARDELLGAAAADAEREKMRMIEAARDEVAAMRAAWQQQVRREQGEFLGGLRRQAAEAVQTIARRALEDMADAGLEERIVETFLDRIASLDRETVEALRDSSEPLQIGTTFELDSRLRARLTRAVHAHVADDVAVDYTRSPDLLCGLELRRGGRRLSWNLADYMTELGERIQDAFSPVEAATERE